MEVLGIDIGGSGIKGAPVDLSTGQLTVDRYRIPTPQPSKPKAVAKVVGQIVKHFNWEGPIGCAFPAIISHGIIKSAANIDDAWIGVDGVKLFTKTTGCPVHILNDADAAGVAEMEFGIGRGRDGAVIMLTIGTGIGSGMFTNGILYPNSELGHLQIRGKDAEHRASDRVRKEEELSWEKWAKRFNEFLNHVEFLFSPDLLIIGGGASKKHDLFFQYLDLDTEILPAKLRNEAGIIGAAMAAKELL